MGSRYGKERNWVSKSKGWREGNRKRKWIGVNKE